MGWTPIAVTTLKVTAHVDSAPFPPQPPSMAITINAISIVRPSGGLIASGRKTLEVRRWSPELSPDEDLLIVENGRFLTAEGDQDDDGAPVAIVRVREVRPFRRSDMRAACANSFADGWLAWELDHVRPSRLTVPVLAARGIYRVTLAASISQNVDVFGLQPPMLKS
jgi:hypothetical protein